MKVFKLSGNVATAILLAVFFALAIYIRTYLPYHDIFVNDWIKFSANDAYYNMRLAENLAANFPHLMPYDPYFIYPSGGGWVGNIHFFIWPLAFVAWVVGHGAPSQQLVDLIGVYYPTVLGALTIIPVYFIGKTLWGRVGGLFAGALIAILPGEWLGRSMLGYTDYHVGETLLTTVTMLFLLMALKAAGQSQLSFSQLKSRDWPAIKKPLIYAALGGLFLGLYMFTWIGALLFVFIFTLFFVVQFIIDHLKKRSTEYLGIIGAVFYFIAFIVFRPHPINSTINFASLLIALIITVLLAWISRQLVGRKLKPAYYPLALVVAAVVMMGIFYLIYPALFKSMLEQFLIFTPAATLQATLEAQPLFSVGFVLPWGNFTTGFFFSFISLAILLYLVFKQGGPDKTLLLVWSLVTLLATLAQRRFAYYFAVNVALLTGYLAWQFIWACGLKKLDAERARQAERESLQQQQKRPVKTRLIKPKKKATITMSHLNVGMAAFVAAVLIFPFNIPAVKAVASQARFAPSDAWYSALSWMKDNTPDPFGDPNFYYKSYQSPAPGQNYQYPKTAYGVTAWWDYGYWITSIAHRLPNTNPSQGAAPIVGVTKFFLAQSETAAEPARQEFNSKYVVIDYQTAVSKYWAIITWAGVNPNDYFEEYRLVPPLSKQTTYVRLFYPAYYRSLCARLYNFDAKAVTPQNTIVVGYEEKLDSGRPIKEITGIQAFPTYAQATEYIDSQKTGHYRIIGNDPFNSPVPLEALKDYKMIYASPGGIKQQDQSLPEVKIFEYTGAAVAQK